MKSTDVTGLAVNLTSDGSLPKLISIMLSALVCVACNSEPVAENEPVAETENIDETVLSDVRNADGCALSIPDAVVDVSTLDVNGGLLEAFDGLCSLSNRVLDNAAELRRVYVKKHYCALPENATTASVQPQAAEAPIALGGIAAPVPYEGLTSAKLQLARSICEDDSVLDWAVEEFLAGAVLQVYSIGTAAYGSAYCPAVVWSRLDDELGQIYNVTGLGKCSGMALPHAQLFNPEDNPEGQLPGDYIRQVLGYNGTLPEYYDYKGDSYRFVSDESVVQNTDAQLTEMQADRSVLGDSASKYIFWSSGDESVDNEYLSSAEALTLQYHSDDLNSLPKPDRALAALQRSYGAPAVISINQVLDGVAPGVHATVATSSGNEFVIMVEPEDGVTEPELIVWLNDANVELLVFQGMDADFNERLTLEGALFTDGVRTVSGQLVPCQCSAQGLLGWLGLNELETTKTIEQARKDFIARERTTIISRDWIVSSEIDPRAISYTLSGYRQSTKDKDAVYVVHDGRTDHTLYVAMDLSCNDESLQFDFGRKLMSVPADCREVENDGVAYTLQDTSNELARAMRGGSTMKVGLMEPESGIIQNEFQFSLMGATMSMNALDADETGYNDAVIRHYRNRALSAEVERRLFEMLEKRPEPCVSSANPPDCVVVAAPAPEIAAAKPVTRSRKVVRTDPDPVDYTLGYAQVLAEQLGSVNQPVCKAVVSRIMKVARSSGLPDTRARQIDLIVGRAPNICF